MVRLSEAALRRLIKGGETATVELKVAAPRSVEMAERLCGMANAHGGVVIIGVQDADHEIVGVPDERIGATFDVIIRAARQIVKPVLVLNPADPEIYVLNGKQVVVATVMPSHGPLYQAGGICWMRRGTHTMPLSVPELIELANDRGLQDWELLPARWATMQDIHLGKVEAYVQQRSASGGQPERFMDVEQVLLGMECVTVTVSSEVVPTNAGILFFGSSPQQHIM